MWQEDMSKKVIFFSVLFLGVIYFLFALQVDNNITESDRIAIETLDVEDVCNHTNETFSREIDCISKIQSAVQSIGKKKCAGKLDIIEPSEFIKRGYGCCFDRSRFIEKAANYYGFKTRHVFLIKPTLDLSLTNILPLGQESHATSEVLTSKGWLGVDPNESFTLLDEQQVPHTYETYLKSPYLKSILNLRSTIAPVDFYMGSLDIIYGLYSRHGFFHGVKLPGPEFVYSEIKYNF